MKSTLNWQGDMEFVAKDESGHEITLEAGEDKKGPSPMEVILHGLGGCTGIDVVLILKKMKVELTEFKMEIEGTRAEEPPKRYTDIEINYILKGKGLSKKKVERAINLSEEKYCSVSASLNANITNSYEFENVE